MRHPRVSLPADAYLNWDYSGSLPKAQMDVAELTADTSFRLPG